MSGKCSHCGSEDGIMSYPTATGHDSSCPVQIATHHTIMVKFKQVDCLSCPVCESDNTDDFDNMDEDGEGNAYHRRKCYDCNSVWQINYKFDCVSDVIKGE